MPAFRGVAPIFPPPEEAKAEWDRLDTVRQADIRITLKTEIGDSSLGLYLSSDDEGPDAEERWRMFVKSVTQFLVDRKVLPRAALTSSPAE